MVTHRAKNLRAEQKEMTRESILVAATKLLGQNGYAALRVAAVAQEAGVSLGGFLHHFPSKESLVVAVLERLSANVTHLVELDAAQDNHDVDILLLISKSAQRFYGSPEFLIYLDIFLSVRHHTLVGDAAIALAISQRSATEALWLPHVTARGIDGREAILLIRTIWGLARGLAISSRVDANAEHLAIMTLVTDALRMSHMTAGHSSSKSGKSAIGRQK
ncbi:helix-turn-helix domain-containing protein [Caballeronia sp. J97]|uniref:TetR/AcrR family transcriptional regulator n=1 Tax=Caballeronia sp. J97 TaxID=2805429 RepID=UPI002AAFE065|nr:helix-turn-helix domain-containing protein [Caballeronia sp. J97]